MRRMMKSSGGVSLPEVMVTMVILVILLSSVSALYFGCARLYRRGEPANSAGRAAAWAIQRLSPDVRQALNCTILNAEKTAIRLRVPAKSWNTADHTHYNVIQQAGTDPYLVAGDYVYYYRGNSSGYSDPTGSYLWRLETTEDGTVVKTYAVATGVIDNPPPSGSTVSPPLFAYWPAPELYRCVLVTVTVQKRMSSQTATSTMASEIALRNH